MRPLIAGNWKMHGRKAEALALAAELARRATAEPPACDLAVFPPAPLLPVVAAALVGSPIRLGGQDCHPQASGPHTGDVSAGMLVDAGCRYVIVGHSERRADHGETDALVRAKAAAARAVGLISIICVGETAAERDAGAAIAVVERQFLGSVPAGVTGDDCVVAYEPVWAIGTGRVPGLADIAAMHGRLRSLAISRLERGDRLRLLYGGSVKPGNARDILAIADVNGALVGGASLSADDFWSIARLVPGAGPPD